MRTDGSASGVMISVDRPSCLDRRQVHGDAAMSYGTGRDQRPIFARHSLNRSRLLSSVGGYSPMVACPPRTRSVTKSS